MIAGAQYKFRVAAVNEMGDGAWSDWSSLTDAPRGYIMDPPNTPTAFGRKDASAAVNNAITISWTGPANANQAGGDLVANVAYEVYGNTGGAMAYLDVVTAAEYTVATVAGQTYQFKVRAMNSAGLTSAFTSVMSLVSATVPGQPQNLVVASTVQNEVSLTWDVPADNGASPITKYQVYSPTTTTWTDIANTLTTATLTGEPGGSVLTYKVRAVNDVGEGVAAQDVVTVDNR